MKSNHGTSLLELLYVLAVAAIVLSVGIPNLAEFVLDSRRTNDINAFVLAIQLARSEAIKRARPVVVCKTSDGMVCGGEETEYGEGWMVFVNQDDGRPPRRSEEEPLLYRHIPRSEGPIRSNRRFFEMRPFRRRSSNGTVVFCDRRGRRAARAVIVSYTGRPRISATGPGDRPLQCGNLP